MKAVIVAAGNGSRMQPITTKMPKPLVHVLGRPIIVRVLETLAWLVDEAIIVTGYLGSHLKSDLKAWEQNYKGVDIRFIHNNEYERGNGISLLRANELIQDSSPFLLLMADHIVERRMVELLLDEADLGFTLVVDSSPRFVRDLEDATKVQTNEQGYITDIGKNLTEWNAIDTGVFLCEPKVFHAARALARQRFTVTITDCMKDLIDRNHRIRAKDLSSSTWLDIDTLADLEYAENVLSQRGLYIATEMGWGHIAAP
jgi:choline kinase